MYETPKVIISDNGTQYTSSLFNSLVKEYNIKHVKIPTYHPFSNGISERINRTIAEMLRMSIGFSMQKIIQDIEHRLNENYHSAIGASPMSIMNEINYYDPLRIRKLYNVTPKREEQEHSVKLFERFKLKQKIFIKNYSTNKLDKMYVGPFEIIEVSDRGLWYKVKGIED